jgi:hypothetical protein
MAARQMHQSASEEHCVLMHLRSLFTPEYWYTMPLTACMVVCKSKIQDWYCMEWPKGLTIWESR